MGRSELPTAPLGSLVALAEGARTGRTNWWARRTLLFCERGLLTARTSPLTGSLVGQRHRDDVPYHPVAALPGLADRILRLHPENRVIPTTSVLDARFHPGVLLLTSRLVLTLADTSRLTFLWGNRLGVLSGDAVSLLAPQEERDVLHLVFGERLSFD